ncbi:hypothetical protein [Virgibacillus sp. DJP39]|uniref:hypothetical protein n=1 Tax=Virgibacillus sp. DJP39 TaxID=3409790 RepID=UPI003BB72366
MSDTKKSIERGQSITFRIPSDTPDHVLKLLQKLKETERRNFSGKIAQYVLNGVNETDTRERETVTIPLPKQLTKEQKSWMKHEHSEALLGSVLYQLLSDPMRATSLLASLNSSTSNMNKAIDELAAVEEESPAKGEASLNDLGDINIDDMQIDLQQQSNKEDENELDDDPLGDFFSSMNK